MAQQAKDILENGIHITSGKVLIIKYDFTSKVLKFDVQKSLQDIANPLDFTTLEDSTIFLVSKNGVNAYLRPLNPLNYSYATENKIITDPVNNEGAAALGVIIDVLKTTTRVIPATTSNGVTTMAPIIYDTCETFLNIETNLKQIQTLIKDNKKESINKVFIQLKSIQFIDSSTTNKQLRLSEADKLSIESSFTKIENLIESTKKMIDVYNCDKPNGFITKYIFSSIAKDLSTSYEEQKKRLTSLKSAYDVVEKARDLALVGGGEIGLGWCFKLDEIPSKEGKISLYSLTIKESGLKLSDKTEIVTSESKDIIKRTFRVRRFQRFVPEVSVGSAYTFFKYNTYGTTKDINGQEILASPTENYIKNLNITTMLNFNYFISNSPINPLWQIGVGVNSGIPTLLTGFGLRGVLGTNRITISGGVAMTWIKELDKLKVGDKISGTSDIEKDLKYQFSWPPKPYIGLQYNF
jgi:hypothetical protein